MDIAKEKLESNTIEVTAGMVSLFSSVPPKEMAEHQYQDNQISPIIEYVKKDQRLPKSSHSKSGQNCHVSSFFSGIGLYLNKEFYTGCTSLTRSSIIS